MKVQVNTGHHIEGHEAFVAHVEATVAKTLSHFSAHITRVEVHVADENAGKHGKNDKKCIMEARLEGRQPIAVTCEAATSGQAVAGAADKLKSALESTMGRLREHREHR